MVAISKRLNYKGKRRREVLELILRPECEENSDSNSSSLSSSSRDSVESGFYDEEENLFKSSQSIEEEPREVSDVEQFDSLLQSLNEGIEQSEDESDDVIQVVDDVHRFDSLLNNPVEDLENSSESEPSSDESEPDSDESELDAIGGELLELLTDSNTEPVAEDDAEDEALQESNFQFSEGGDLDEADLEERVERAVDCSESLVTAEVKETGEMFALTTPDTRAQTFLHKVDRSTFQERLDTVGEVNLFRLAGWQGKVTYEQSKRRGGLRDCFSQEMKHFQEVHRQSVKRLVSRQASAAEREPVEVSSLTVRVPAKPKLIHYQDFISLR